MKIRISLLVACLAIVGIARPIDAEIIKDALPSQDLTKAKSLETILRDSGLCKQYPIAIKILNDNTAEIATYADRRLSDGETKLLALNIAKFISTNINKIVEVKVRLYDPASIKYWRDIALSAAQIEGGLKSGPEQEETLNSIKIVNNMGLIDSPNLEPKIGVYKRILKLKAAGVDVRPYLKKLAGIETADKKKKKIATQLTELNASLSEVDATFNKPISSRINGNELESTLRQSWQDACNSANTALKAVEEAEQEQNNLTPPSVYDNDAQARYQNDYEGRQRKIDAALAAWQEACRYRELTHDQLKQATEHY